MAISCARQLLEQVETANNLASSNSLFSWAQTTLSRSRQALLAYLQLKNPKWQLIEEKRNAQTIRTSNSSHQRGGTLKFQTIVKWGCKEMVWFRDIPIRLRICHSSARIAWQRSGGKEPKLSRSSTVGCVHTGTHFVFLAWCIHTVGDLCIFHFSLYQWYFRCLDLHRVMQFSSFLLSLSNFSSDCSEFAAQQIGTGSQLSPY